MLFRTKLRGRHGWVRTVLRDPGCQCSSHGDGTAEVGGRKLPREKTGPHRYPGGNTAELWVVWQWRASPYRGLRGRPAGEAWPDPLVARLSPQPRTYLSLGDRGGQARGVCASRTQSVPWGWKHAGSYSPRPLTILGVALEPGQVHCPVR